MNKKEFTKLFLEQAGEPTDDESIKTHLKLWWDTPLSPYSLRLTHKGAVFLSKNLKLEFYTCQIAENRPSTLKHLLMMSKHLQSPYYLTNEKIHLFGETDAVMLQLHAGNLIQYVSNISSVDA